MGRLRPGDRIRLIGGYDPEPSWLEGAEHIDAAVEHFIPGQNDSQSLVVRPDNWPSDYLVLELRYVGAEWINEGVVHVERCDFMPGAKPWAERERGKWVESHASYQVLS